MIYFLVQVLYLLGVGHHIMQVVTKLRKRFPVFGFRQIFATFFNEEWDSLIRSALVSITYQLFLVIIHMAEVQMPFWWEKYLAVYGIALFLGYSGQRIFYKFLGTTEKILEQKVDQLNHKP